MDWQFVPTLEEAEAHERQCHRPGPSMETRKLHEAKARAAKEVEETNSKQEGGKEYTMVWTCDVCKTEQFEDFDEAVAHEATCPGSIYLYPKQHPQLCLQRLKLGQCPDCGRQTYEVDPLTGSRQCLTNANVLKGRCLLCHPLPANVLKGRCKNVVAPDG